MKIGKDVWARIVLMWLALMATLAGLIAIDAPIGYWWFVLAGWLVVAAWRRPQR